MPGFINTGITMTELIGDGSAYGKAEKSHQLGLSAERCAYKIIQGLSKKKKNIAIGKFEILGIYIHRISPNLYDFMIKNHPMKKWYKLLSFFGINRS